jgi:hypothetical protein
MKRLTIFILGIMLQAASVFAQDHYQFPPETWIIDIPGDHFLTWKIDDNQVIFRERSAQSAVVWSETLNADLSLDMVDFHMQRFGETDQYRVFLVGFVNGTTVIRHASFSPQTHVFGPFRTDTLSDFGIETCSVNDTLLYLFTDDAQVWSITASGAMDLVAANIGWPEPYSSTFTSANNEILHLWNGSQNLHTRRYDLQMQPLADEDSLTILGDYTYRQELVRQWNGSDSLFAAFFTHDYAPTHLEGRFMTWLSPDLEVLDSYIEESPGDEPYFQSTPEQAAVTSEYVYFIGKLTPGNAPYEWRIYVYDRSFTPVCDFVTYSNFFHNLTVVNDRAYVIDMTPQYVELFLIDGCGVAGLDENEESDLMIHPNPTHGSIAIDFGPETAEVIEVCDLNGKTVMYRPVGQVPGTMMLDLGHLEDGMYLVKAIGKNNTNISRIVLEK